MKTRRRRVRSVVVLVLCIAVSFPLSASGEREAENLTPIPRDGMPSVATGRSELLGDHLIFNLGEYSLELDLTDLSCLVIDAESRVGTVVSHAAFSPSEFHINEVLSEVFYPEYGITVRIGFTTGRFTLEFSSNRSQSVAWPTTPLAVDEDAAILPIAEGHYIPLSDDPWRAHLLENESAFSEFLSMPFWGIEHSHGLMFTFMVDNPFHNRLGFEGELDDDEIDLGFRHWFPDNHDVAQNVAVTVCIDPAVGDLLVPARHFRERFIERGEFVSFREKIATAPLNERLIGAAHGVLHGGDILSIHDIIPGRAKALAIRITDEAERDAHGLAARIRSLLLERYPEAWDAVVELAESPWDLRYLHIDLCYHLSRLLESHDLSGENLSSTDIVRDNSALLYARYGEYLNPPETWGGAISTRMIDTVTDAGFDRFRFQIDGVEQVDDRPEVAVYADEAGYLFGTYDSYHSIHDPVHAGTDFSWETAQFDRYAYENGGVQRSDGSLIRGFLRRGHRFSPIFARPYYEERIRRNFAAVPFTYYFIDCDAYGEYSDDYTRGRVVSQREDAEERVDRIRWLVETQSIPVGSEGGFYLFTPVLSIVEGLIYPVIAWGDEDMRDPDSDFFLGRHWPPHEPTIHFAQVPLKEEYYHLYIDPRFKLPLYEAVFHDSVVAIPRDGGTRKFTNAQGSLELCHLLYQTPPLYHLSLQSGEEILAEAFPLYAIFRESHEYSIDHALTEFAYLTADRMVQRSIFGELEIIANFRDTHVTVEELTIPAMSAILLRGENRWEYSANPAVPVE